MNGAHLHLVLNHFPIIGIFFVFALFLWGTIKKSTELKNVAKVFFIGIALITVPVFLTGEPAEETIENLPEVSHSVLEEHEEAAEAALVLIEILGAFSLLSLVAQSRGKQIPKENFVFIALALVAIAAVVRTGNLGGQIRHSEIRSLETSAQNLSR